MKAIHLNSQRIKLSLLAGILLLCVNPVFSQQETTEHKQKKLYGGFGHLNFSGEQLNLSGINQALLVNNYRSISLYSSSFGGGGSFAFNNFLVGGGGSWLMHSKTQNTENSVNLKGGYGYFSFGYIVHSTKRALLYPTISVGGGGYTIIVSKNNQQNDFSQQLNSPSGMITLDAGGWMTALQLTYLHFFGKKSLEGYFVGFKAGYKYSPYNWKTKMYTTSLAGSPKINMNGLYLTLIIGGGSISAD